MQTLAAPQPTVANRHKPGTVLSRKERQGQTMDHTIRSQPPFFAPTIQAKQEAPHEAEQPVIQAKSEQPQPDAIQAKEIESEREDIHRKEDENVQRSEHDDIQKSPTTSATPTQPTSDFTGGLTIGRPNDRFEREADHMGEQVSRMPISGFSGQIFASAPATLQRHEDETADVQAKLLPVAPSLQRKSDGGLQASGQFTSQVQASAGGGTALPQSVQQGMGSAFQADFSNVRIHTDTQAAQLSNDIGAKAFTYQNNIFFNDNQYDPGSSDGRFLLAHELTHTVQQGAAVQRSTMPITATAPHVQASFLDDAIDWLVDHFNPDAIPGYSLFSVLINYDILRRRRVEMNAENLVKGLLELIPIFGMLLYNLLQEHQVITRAFTWVKGELSRLNLTTDRLKNTVSAAWDDMHLIDGIDANIEVLKRHFVPLKNDVVSFAESVKNELLSMLKEALVGVLKGLAVDKIPGYTLFTKVVGHDPITGQDVSATLEELIADFLDLIGKQQEREEMQKRGTIQRTADWLRAKLGQFLGLFTQLKALIVHLWEAFSFETLRDPIGKLNELITEAKGFVKNVWDFASEVALTVLKFIKDALLGLLRTHAHEIRGYKLLTVIMGKDPVTDEAVERNAVNLIGGFIELVAGPEKFQEMQQTGAIAEMATWIEAQIATLNLTWAQIKKLFSDIWNGFTIQDLIHPIAAFGRVVDQFGAPLGRILSFIVKVFFKLIEVILVLMGLRLDLVTEIIAKATQAYEDIKRDPIAFFKNLLAAVKQGFSQFFKNIGTHLLNGLVGWLTSELKQANITPPKDFTLKSVLTFVLDVLGISVEKIWKKLGEHPKIGPQKVAKIRSTIDKLSGIWTFISDVVRDGPGAIWKHIQEKLANLWDTVLGMIKDWITEKIIDQMVTKLLSMLDPTGIMAVVNSFMAFYRAVQSFIEKINEILQIVSSFVGGVAEIARGVIQKAADFLERAMAGGIPVIIGFLANQVGLRGLGKRIGEMIGKLQDVVDKGLTWLINKAVEVGGQLLEMGKDAVEALIDWWKASKTFSGKDSKQHKLYLEGSESQAELMVASKVTKFSDFIQSIQTDDSSEKKAAKESADPIAKEIDKKKQQLLTNRNLPKAEKKEAARKSKKEIEDLLNRLSVHVSVLMDGKELPDGSFEKPIPIRWTKTGHIQTLYLFPIVSKWENKELDPPQPVQARFNEQTSLHLPSNRTITVGIAPANLPTTSKKLQRKTLDGSRTWQAFLRDTVFKEAWGFSNTNDMKADKSGYDIDHVQDKQWAGKDELPNLWPLYQQMNRQFGNKINDQVVAYSDKDGKAKVGTPKDLTGKWFIIDSIGNLE